MSALPPTVVRFARLMLGSEAERIAIDARDTDALRRLNPALVAAMEGARTRRSARACDACGGTRYRPQYRHISGGICYHCT